MDRQVSCSQFIFCGGCNISASTGHMHFLKFLCDKGWCDPNSPMASVRLNCLDQSDEFSVVGAIVHSVALEESEQFLVGRHRGHNALSLGVIGAA